MPHENVETIESVVSEIMEQLAFVFLDRIESQELPESIEKPVRVTLGFSGAASGRLELITSKAVTLELAANITGDEEMGAEAAELTLMEVANIVCGRLLIEIAGTTPVFDLHTPVIEPWSEAHWHEAMNNHATVAFLSDDQPLLVRFEMTGVPLSS